MSRKKKPKPKNNGEVTSDMSHLSWLYYRGNFYEVPDDIARALLKGELYVKTKKS